MQIWLSAEALFLYALVIGSIIFVVYVILGMFRSGPVTRAERTGGRPREENEYRVMQGSYGYDVSYTPGNRASSAGPLPVGGRQERSPTRSFRSYTKPRRDKREED